MAEPVIQTEEVERVARLARLSPSAEEVAALRDALAAILEYVKLLDELDTSKVEATMHPVCPKAPLRDDVVKPGTDREQALAQAPAHRDGGFSVPKVLEVEG